MTMADQPPEVVADEPLDPFADPAAPEPPRTYRQPQHTEETPEQRARRCPHYKLCVCDHTECREGWLDADEPNPTALNPHNVANRRCPRCNDARIMHSEEVGMRGGRRR